MSAPTTRSSGTPAARLVALATLAVLAAVLATFVWLRREMARDLERIAEVQTAALSEAVVGDPLSPQLRYAELAKLVTAFEGSPSVARAAVSKTMFVPRLPGEAREVIVAPADLGRAPLDDATAGAIAFAIPRDAAGAPGVTLYLWPDTTRLDVVTAWVAVLSTLIVVTALAAMWRATRREKLLAHTALELETKRGELRRAERLAFTGQLAAGLLHDLKKPVNTIRAVASEKLYEPQVDGDNDWKDVAEQTDLFHGLLRSTRFERFAQAAAGDETEWCDLVDIVQRSLDLVQCERRGVEVRTEFEPPTDALIQANPYELIQVFSNLILNAYQALDGSGVVTLIVRGSANEQPSERGLEIVVADNGPGVAEEFRSRLFDPFATTRLDAGGSGLGTYIAREIIAALGGSLDLMPPDFCADKPDAGGAVFRVWLPLAAAS